MLPHPPIAPTAPTSGNPDIVRDSNHDDADSLERRVCTRVLVDLQVDCESEENYLFASITDISATGIFIRTNEPELSGTHVNLRFAAPPRTIVGVSPANDNDHYLNSSGEFTLEGRVAWVNPVRPGPSDSLHPGMGVRFVDLTDLDRLRLARLIRRIAYLPDHS